VRCVDRFSAERFAALPLRPPSTSRSPRYQGDAFKSGAYADCSGRPPAICISAITRTPAHPPTRNAAIAHHIESIWLPRFSCSRARNSASPLTRSRLGHGALERNRRGSENNVGETPGQRREVSRVGTRPMHRSKIFYARRNVYLTSFDPRSRGSEVRASNWQGSALDRTAFYASASYGARYFNRSSQGHMRHL
jgi:hypothetical protein